jgi:hypothetical protein
MAFCHASLKAVASQSSAFDWTCSSRRCRTALSSRGTLLITLNVCLSVFLYIPKLVCLVSSSVCQIRFSTTPAALHSLAGFRFHRHGRHPALIVVLPLSKGLRSGSSSAWRLAQSRRCNSSTNPPPFLFQSWWDLASVTAKNPFWQQLGVIQRLAYAADNCSWMSCHILC